MNENPSKIISLGTTKIFPLSSLFCYKVKKEMFSLHHSTYVCFYQAIAIRISTITDNIRGLLPGSISLDLFRIQLQSRDDIL